MMIKIFGGKGEGKSTVAKLIEQTLIDLGISVENSERVENWEERLKVITEAAKHGDHLQVEIKCIPYARETLPQYAVEFNKRS